MPSREDIAMLKDAEANIRQDLWEDGHEEPPGALQEAASELVGESCKRRRHFLDVLPTTGDAL